MRTLSLLFLLPACVARHTGEVVQGIRFDVEGRRFPASLWVPQNDGALRGALDQRTSTVQSLFFPGAIEPEWLDEARQDGDAKRIEVWFAEHGYFDVNFVRWERKAGWLPFWGKKMRPVFLVGHVSQAEPSRVRAVTLVGAGLLEPRLRKAISLVEGRVFSSTEYTLTLAALRAALLGAGYAFAEVTGTADAWPDEHVVDVRFDVVAGPRSTFGAVEIEGIERMPEDIVARRVTFKEGDPFTPKELAETRAALFGLQVFSVVNVTPDLSAPDTATVPVLIDVRGTKTRRIKLGPGVEVEAGKIAAYAAAQYQDRNLFARLWSFDASLEAGAAGVLAQKRLYDGFDLEQLTIAPLIHAKTSLAVPDVPGPDWSIEVDARVQYDIEPGYRFVSPEVAPAITWRQWDHLKVAGGYRLKYFDYLDFTVDIQDIVDSPLGLDLTDPFLLSMLEQSAIWDGRDNPVDPHRGWYASVNLAEAGGPVFGNFTFIRAAGEVRAYREAPRLLGWNPKVVIAARLGGGGIAPYGVGAKANVPYAERLHLGGGTSVRGWGADRLGPRMVVSSLTGSGDEIVATGGLFDLFGNLELRKLVGLGISVAAFSDVGQVWSTPSDVTFDTLQWTVGGGLRYATAIGPIRADVGVRLGPDTNYTAAERTEQPRWTLHFGLAEAF